jgi:hypothetical protein
MLAPSETKASVKLPLPCVPSEAAVNSKMGMVSACCYNDYSPYLPASTAVHWPADTTAVGAYVPIQRRLIIENIAHGASTSMGTGGDWAETYRLGKVHRKKHLSMFQGSSQCSCFVLGQR